MIQIGGQVTKPITVVKMSSIYCIQVKGLLIKSFTFLTLLDYQAFGHLSLVTMLLLIALALFCPGCFCLAHRLHSCMVYNYVHLDCQSFAMVASYVSLLTHNYLFHATQLLFAFALCIKYLATY